MSDRNTDSEPAAGHSENVPPEAGTAPQGGQAGQHGHPPQQTESVTDLATDPVTKTYVKFLAATFALVGAAASVAVILVGFVGGSPLSSSLIDAAQAAMQMSGSSPSADIASMMDQLYVNRLAFQAINGAPLAAAVLGVGSGFYVANHLDSSDRHTYVTAALGAGIGAALLVAIVGALVTTLAVSPIQLPEQAQQAAGSTTLSGGSVSGAISVVYIGGTDLAFKKLALNSVAIGVGVGLVSTGAAYVSRELSPVN